ncbi:MAG: hypothetical protein KAH48_01775 [Chlorobi bacterium]|nr:hypothetical protein [Chlorobiota bacterium]
MAINILIGVFILYLILNLLAIGFFAGILISELRPDEIVTTVFNGGILPFLLVDLLMRYMVQSLPVLSIQNYLHLPMKKKSIVHFLLIKTLTSGFNFIPIFVFIPFALMTVADEYSFLSALVWLMSVYVFMLINNFITIYFKKQSAAKPAVSIIFLAVLLVLTFLNQQNIIDISGLSVSIFNGIIRSPHLIIIPIVSLAGLYFMNFNFLMSNTYLEELNTRKKKDGSNTSDMSFLERFDKTGTLLTMHIRCIWRNKRPKGVLMMSVIFLLYGFIFYMNEGHGASMLILPGFFITGLFVVSYGNFLISWDGSYFDSLLTQNISSYDYLYSKFMLFVPIVVVMFILSTGYGLIYGWHIVLINFAMAMLTIGVNSLLVMYFATFNPKKIDLSKSASFNFEGVNASQYIVMIPVFALPFVIYLITSFFVTTNQSFIIMAAIGIINFMFHKQWIGLIARRLDKQKYKIAENFRQP